MTTTTTTAPGRAGTDQQTLVTVLAAAVEAGVTPLLWGGPGIGKSALVEGVAAARRVRCETVIGSLRDPADFGGLPVITDTGVRFEPPAWALRLQQAATTEPADDAEHVRGGLLFLDELSTSAPAVQAAMLSVIFGHRVGDLSLPRSVAIVAAANPPEHAAGGWDLAAPLANRLMHLHVTADPDTWVTGMMTGFALPAPRTVHVRSRARTATARAQIAAFIRTRPGLLHAFPADAAATGQAWPSPRTWAMTADVLAVLPEQDADARLAAATGLVGDGPAIELVTWLAEADLPDPAAVLADPAAVAWADLDPSRVWAILTGGCHLLLRAGHRDRVARGLGPPGGRRRRGLRRRRRRERPRAADRPDGARVPAAVKAFHQAITAAGLGTRAAA